MTMTKTTAPRHPTNALCPLLQRFRRATNTTHPTRMARTSTVAAMIAKPMPVPAVLSMRHLPNRDSVDLRPAPVVPLVVDLLGGPEGCLCIDARDPRHPGDLAVEDRRCFDLDRIVSLPRTRPYSGLPSTDRSRRRDRRPRAMLNSSDQQCLLLRDNSSSTAGRESMRGSRAGGILPLQPAGCLYTSLARHSFRPRTRRARRGGRPRSDRGRDLTFHLLISSPRMMSFWTSLSGRRKYLATLCRLSLTMRFT